MKPRQDVGPDNPRYVLDRCLDGLRGERPRNRGTLGGGRDQVGIYLEELGKCAEPLSQGADSRHRLRVVRPDQPGAQFVNLLIFVDLE